MWNYFLALIFFLPIVVSASPIRHYELEGFIDEPNTIEASTKLKDVKFGDAFKLEMSVHLDEKEQLSVLIGGTIGAWEFYPEPTYGYYYLGDWSPERLGMEISGGGRSPQGDNCTISQFWAQLLLFGYGSSTDTNVPYEEWLLKDEGFVDPQWFQNGQLNFFFTAELPSGELQSHGLTGTVTSLSLRQVPETNSLGLMALGIAVIGRRIFRRRNESIT